MATTFTHAAQFNAVSELVTFGTNAAFDTSSFTIGVLAYLTGNDQGVFVSRQDATNGFHLNLFDQLTNDALDCKMLGTTADWGRFADTVTFDAWNWIFITWSGTAWGVRSGVYGGSLATRTPSILSSGTGLTSPNGLPIRLGAVPTISNYPVDANVAFLGVWNTVLGNGTIDTYAADMTAAGTTAAVEYWKWVSTDTAGISGAKAISNGTYTSISLVAGPDVAVLSDNRTLYADGGIIAGSTDVSLIVPLPAQTTSGTAGLKIAYTRSGGAAVTATAVSNTATGGHTDWSIVPCDPTNIPELHRIDLPDAAFAVGADLLTLSVSATGMAATHFSYPLRQPAAVYGTVVPGTLEVTTFSTSVPNTTNQLARRILEFTSGPNAGQRVAIVGNNGSGVLQVAPPLLATPVAGNGFVIH